MLSLQTYREQVDALARYDQIIANNFFDPAVLDLAHILTQATVFSEHGACMRQLFQITDVRRVILNERLWEIEKRVSLFNPE